MNVDYLALYPDGAQPPTDVAPADSGTTSDYRQSLDLRTGVLATSFDWTSPAGDKTSFDYEVNANRGEGHLGTVTVRAVPHWSGTATAVDEFDAQGLDHASATDPHVDGKTAALSQTVVTDGKLVTAGLNSVLRVNGDTVPTEPIAAPGNGSAGQSAAFPVRAGRSYQITKYVGVASSVDTDRSLTAATPEQAAASTAAGSARRGYQHTLAGNNDAWSRLWQSSISIPGDTADDRADPRVHVLPAREHARRRHLEHQPGRAVLGRLQRPRVLGHGDLDVPVAAGPVPRHRGRREHLPAETAPRGRGRRRRAVHP